MTNNMRRGFTMIELVFVIVIIGILAAVAIPKLAQNRDDAAASVCVSDVGNIISGATVRYTKEGFAGFRTVQIQDIFNGNMAVQNNTSGVVELATDPVRAGITYNCEGGQAVAITFAQDANNPEIYQMTLSTAGASTTIPTAIKAARLIAKANGFEGQTSKTIDM